MNDNKTPTDNVLYKLRDIKSRLLEALGVSSVLSWKHRFGNVISQLLSHRVWVLIEFSTVLET